MKSTAIRALYIILAFLFLGIGVLGIVVPILPTTPFLLLASFFFAKGSDRFNKWFISTKIYKNHLEDFIKTRAMTLKKKLYILLPVSTMLIITFIFIKSIYARIGIILVIIYKYYYFFTHIKTIEKCHNNIDEEVGKSGELLSQENKYKNRKREENSKDYDNDILQRP